MRLPWSPQSVAVGASAAAASDAGAGEKSSGRLGEVFVSTNKIGSAADAIARDGAILLSLALQHNVPLDTIKNALTREANGEPSTIIGAVVDRLLGEAR